MVTLRFISEFSYKMKKKTLLTFIIAMFIGISSYAQMGWEVGGYGGVAYYFGDLNTRFHLGTPGPAAGFIGRYNFNKRLALRFGLHYGSVSADDANSKNSYEQRRNLSFKSNIFEGAAMFEFNFLPLEHGSHDEFFTPYVFAGFSIFKFNPKAELDGEWIELNPLGTEGQFQGDEYFLVSPAFVYGLGIKLSIANAWSLNFELSSRILTTDYLDDVSKTFPDKDDLESLRGETAVIMSDRSIPNAEGLQIGSPGKQRGDDSNKDYFSFIGIGVTYYFGDIRCPTF